MERKFLIYGATGYTGRLVVGMAVEAGMKPLLSGRNPEKLEAIAKQFDLEYVAVSLSDQGELEKLLDGVDVVLHIAGPFSATAAPMLEACLKTKTHYLDITGEIQIFERHARMDGVAKEAGIMIMSGVGLDVVPTDCMAAHLKAKMNDATHLKLSIAGSGGLSPGTAKTAAEGIGYGTAIRRNGKIELVNGRLEGSADFGRGERDTVAIGWGDVSTAYYTTGIPNITVFFRSSPILRILTGMGSGMKKMLSGNMMQKFIKKRIDGAVKGPTGSAREKGYSIIVGEVENEKGDVMRSRLTAPEGYTLTGLTGLEIVRRVMDNDFESGFKTPAGMYGADFILQFEGVERIDI